MKVEFRAGLKVRRGKLAPEGTEVHAATFLRERRIVLDSELLKDPGELRRIFAHELFHFVWWKLGNPRRLAWEAVLAGEFRRRARGEMGWSSEWRKERLTAKDVAGRTRAWREYCCESFCDSGASLFMGSRAHEEVTLSSRFRQTRESWFRLGDIIRNEEDLVQFVAPQNGVDGFGWRGGFRSLFPLAHGSRPIVERIERSSGSAGV